MIDTFVALRLTRGRQGALYATLELAGSHMLLRVKPEHTESLGRTFEGNDCYENISGWDVPMLRKFLRDICEPIDRLSIH